MYLYMYMLAHDMHMCTHSHTAIQRHSEALCVRCACVFVALVCFMVSFPQVLSCTLCYPNLSEDLERTAWVLARTQTKPDQRRVKRNADLQCLCLVVSCKVLWKFMWLPLRLARSAGRVWVQFGSGVPCPHGPCGCLLYTSPSPRD